MKTFIREFLDKVTAAKQPKTHTVSFYVPSTNKDQVVNLDLLKARTAVIAVTFSKLAGGATVTPGEGWYIGNDETTIVETVNVVTTFTESNIFEQVLALATKYVQEWEQESVMFTWDGEPHFVG